MENQNVTSTLARLAQMTQKAEKKGTTASTKFFKPKPGKNNLVLLPTPLTGDPFMEWHTHKNLLEKPFMDIQCDKLNKGDDCLICQVVEDLQKQNWKGNFPIWKPLEVKTRYYAPVIDLDHVEEGVQLWGFGTSVLKQFETWLLNLDEGEVPFYETTAPQKIIVSYDPSAAPADMYKLDKKPFKPFAAEQVATWSSSIRPLKEVFGAGKSKDEIATALSKYMERMKEQVASATPEDDAASSKLSGLKNS